MFEAPNEQIAEELFFQYFQKWETKLNSIKSFHYREEFSSQINKLKNLDLENELLQSQIKLNQIETSTHKEVLKEFSKEDQYKFLNNMQQILIIFCSTGHNYSQGLSYLVLPFVILTYKLNDNGTEAYNLFQIFMSKFYNNIYITKINEKSKSQSSDFVYANLIYFLCQSLLWYHCCPVMNQFIKQSIQWVQFQEWYGTLFTRKITNIKIILYIFDLFIQRQDSLYLVFMVIAVFALNQKELLSCTKNHEEYNYCISYLKQNIEELVFSSSENIDAFFKLADKIQSQTPHSFIQQAMEKGYYDREKTMSIQEIDFLKNVNSSEKDWVWVKPTELLSILQNSKTQENSSLNINDFLFIDLCKNKNGNSYKGIDLKQHLKQIFINKKIYNNESQLSSIKKYIEQDIIKNIFANNNKQIKKICLLTTFGIQNNIQLLQESDKETFNTEKQLLENFFTEFRKMNINFVCYLQFGIMHLITLYIKKNLQHKNGTSKPNNGIQGRSKANSVNVLNEKDEKANKKKSKSFWQGFKTFFGQ